MKKTSEQWATELLPQMKIKILDHDGWDRNNFQYSWQQELITKEEFEKRLCSCTIERTK